MYWQTILSWDWQIVSSCVIAIATVSYTVGTFLLWRATCKSIDSMRDVFKLNFLEAYWQTQVPLIPEKRPLYRKRLAEYLTRREDLLKRVFHNDFGSLINISEKSSDEQD